ncbi:MAG: ABC transporter substrate-binding protein [Actinomycetota bacterium]
MNRRRSLAALLLGCGIFSGCGVPESEDKSPPAQAERSDNRPVWRVVVMGGKTDDRLAAILRGAELAAAELSDKGLEGRRVHIDQLAPSGPDLAGLTDDRQVIGAITVAGADAIRAAGNALDDSRFAVFEMADDLYETGGLSDSVFQVPAPRPWQAFRMARYFGPGDRGYRKAGLLREPGPDSESAAAVLKEALERRGVAFIDAPGGVEEALGNLEGARPEAVVVHGSGLFRSRAVKALSQPPRLYGGKPRIADGWRPQPAFFEEQLGAEGVMAGAVAAGDYAGFLAGTPVERPARFNQAFRARYKRDPSGIELSASDCVYVLAEAIKRAGGLDRPKLLEELEGFDRVRFGRLPISLGPDDHVVAERDVLGLWAAGKGTWRPVMRTFTSDLERTNVLEEDWSAFFDGTTPGGEAPFYHQAKSGITSDKGDPLN